MHRRALLRRGSVVVGAALIGGSTAAARDEIDDGEEMEPVEFDGEGVSVTDEIDISGGLTVIDATHTGSSTFTVQFVPAEDGVDYRLLEHTGAFDGSTGAFVEEGTYVVYVDADGPWDLTVRQPRVADDEADSLPISIDGSGTSWNGPILFEETVRVTALYEDNSGFRIGAVPQEIEDNEFVWNGSELVFDAIGPFAGATTINTDGVGYVNITADGDWAVELA